MNDRSTSVAEDRLRQVLSKAGRHETGTLQEYMNKHAMTALFPRPLEILSNPSLLPVSRERTRFDDHLSCLSQLNQVTSLSRQIQEDVSTNTRPKYLAHQIALLYQSLASLPSAGPLERFRKSIGANFKSLKRIMAADGEEQQGQPLPHDLQTWEWELTSQLADTVESMPAEITSPAVVPAMLLAHMAGHRCS